MYDEECAKLAEYFLDDKATADNVAVLAQVIQSAIEDWLEDHDL